MFEGEGEETADTHAGDLVVVLRQKPHPAFRRTGRKGLEVFAGAAAPGAVVHAAEVATLGGGRHVVVCPVLRAALEGGGVGGTWKVVLPGQVGGDGGGGGGGGGG